MSEPEGREVPPANRFFFSDGLHSILWSYRARMRIPDWLRAAGRTHAVRSLVFITDGNPIEPNLVRTCQHLGYEVTLLGIGPPDARGRRLQNLIETLKPGLETGPVLFIATPEAAGAVEREISAMFPNHRRARLGPSARPRAGRRKEVAEVNTARPLPAVMREKVEAAPGESGPPVFFSIRAKLLLIISAIVAGALFAMIFLASRYFTEDVLIRVQEQNLMIARLTGARVKLELQNRAFRSLTLARNQAEVLDGDEILYLGKYRVAGGQRILEWDRPQAAALSLRGLDPPMLEKLARTQEAVWHDVAQGTPRLCNISAGFSRPLFVLGLPAGGDGAILLVFFTGESLLESFREPGERRTFLVDRQGFVIAHNDESAVLSVAHVGDQPPVRKMWSESPTNAQLTYAHDGETRLAAYQKLEYAGLGVVTTLSRDLALAPVFDMQRRNLFILGVCVTVAILIAVFFSRTLSVPIVRLMGIARRVEAGDFAAEVGTRSRDEIGRLTLAFGRMARGLKERERIQDALVKFASREIAEKALSGELNLGGENKTCVVFFSDLRNFTRIGEGMSPGELLQFLNEYYTEMANWIIQEKGVLDKFIGDAMMAWWGAVESGGPAVDTEHAISAALLMRRSLITMNQDRLRLNKPRLGFGVGINYGPVVAGQIGSQNRFQYTVIGDTVNLASRIESLNVYHGTDILISESAYQNVKSVFRALPMPIVPIKGKTEKVQLFAVLGRVDDPGAPGTLEELRARVGIEGPRSTKT